MTTTTHNRAPSITVLPPHKLTSMSAHDTQSLDSVFHPSSLVNSDQDVNHNKESSSHLLAVSIDGKPAYLGHDHEFLFVHRGHRQAALSEPSKAHLRVPLALVLNTSFVADSDGGSLLVRLLSPPIQIAAPPTSGFSFFKKIKSQPSCIQSLPPDVFDGLSPKQRSERLQEQLNGPCSNLRLVKIEARVLSTKDGEEVESRAQSWVESVMTKAYKDVQPYRRVKVLVNPVGGQGKGRQLFESRVRPILEAAGCVLDVAVTVRRMHGLDIAKHLDIHKFDAMALVSGDGLLHEVLNGLANRPDSDVALKLPIAPIPAGSGNAMAINLMGVEHGFSLALACLNIIKGKPMNLDLLTVTQPASAFPPGIAVPGTSLPAKSDQATVNSRALGSARESSDAARLIDAPSKPYVQYYSFLSQAIGIAAELDLGTENLRAIGDTRFLIGYATSVLRNAECEVDIDVKLGLKGSKNKAEMRNRVADFNQQAQWSEPAPAAATAQAGLETTSIIPSAFHTDDGSDPINTSLRSPDTSQTEAWRRDALSEELSHSKKDGEGVMLIHGPVTEPLTAAGSIPPPFDMFDPSWPYSIIGDSRSNHESTPARDQRDGWYRIQEPIASLYAGKVPFVGRDLMQFPYALPHDGTIDVSMILHAGGRASKVPETGYAESGQVIYQRVMTYLKVEAIRVTPRRKEGDKKLKRGGLIAIDGEKVPYAPFQVEVAQGMSYSVLSLYGQFCVPLVEPPKVK